MSGQGETFDEQALEALLTAAFHEGRVDAEGERRALDAFRAAREAGAHRARTRRRDDWRPRAQRWAARSRSVRTTLGLVLASLAVGGVAVAAIGTARSSGSDSPDTGPGRSHASTSAPDRSATTAPTAPAPGAGSATPDRPATAKDTEAHCRAYEQVKGKGKALESTAWQRLIQAAGGEDKVAAYCAAQLAQATPGAQASTAGNGTGTGNGNGNGNKAGTVEKTPKAKGKNK